MSLWTNRMCRGAAHEDGGIGYGEKPYLCHQIGLVMDIILTSAGRAGAAKPG